MRDTRKLKRVFNSLGASVVRLFPCVWRVSLWRDKMFHQTPELQVPHPEDRRSATGATVLCAAAA